MEGLLCKPGAVILEMRKAADVSQRPDAMVPRVCVEEGPRFPLHIYRAVYTTQDHLLLTQASGTFLRKNIS